MVKNCFSILCALISFPCINMRINYKYVYILSPNNEYCNTFYKNLWKFCVFYFYNGNKQRL